MIPVPWSVWVYFPGVRTGRPGFFSVHVQRVRQVATTRGRSPLAAIENDRGIDLGWGAEWPSGSAVLELSGYEKVLLWVPGRPFQKVFGPSWHQSGPIGRCWSPREELALFELPRCIAERGFRVPHLVLGNPPVLVISLGLLVRYQSPRYVVEEQEHGYFDAYDIYITNKHNKGLKAFLREAVFRHSCL